MYCQTHQPIDNGTRVTECRACKRRLVLKGFEWHVDDAQLESREDPTGPESIDWDLFVSRVGKDL